MNKNLLIGLMFLLLISLANAVTLDSGTVLNTTLSNSSMTFNTITVTVDQVTVEPTYIELFNISYTSAQGVAQSFPYLNWSTPNTNLDSSQFWTVLDETTLTEETITSSCSTMADDLAGTMTWLGIILIVVFAFTIFGLFNGGDLGALQIETETLGKVLLGVISAAIVIVIGIMIVKSMC